MEPTKLIVLLIFVACYTIALSRKVKLAYASIGAALCLLLFGIVKPEDAILKAINWNVLGIYWGFMMVSYAFMKSGMPELIANKFLVKVKTEKYVIFSLCVFTALISSFMENVATVLIVAPIAIAMAKKLKSSLFPYLVAIAISSNVVTTVSMIADPPSLILAMETGMGFLDFYWFQNKPGLGTLTIIGVGIALLSLLLIFRKFNKKVDVEPEKINVKSAALLLFAGSIIALAIAPNFGFSPGIVGLIVGMLAILIEREHVKEMFKEFDWNSFMFIFGIFIVIFSVNDSGLLKDIASMLVQSGLRNPALMLAFVIWVSVALSSFIDNVPFAMLMIPVCTHLASLSGMSPWPLLFGMLVGTGIGGNITPIGATANVFACGILEKQGYKIKLKEYIKIGLPFSVVAVAIVHILLQIFWL